MAQRLGVAAVILAAGESRRFGSVKQLALFEGRTLLEHVVGLARGAGLGPIVAVVPEWLTLPSAVDHPDLIWIRNPHPELGMSHTLRLGFLALPEETEAAVILLGDQPSVPVDVIKKLIALRRPKPMVATRAAGRLAAPVLIERSHFSIVDLPGGDIGLREILRAHADEVTAVEVDAHPPDVDTPEDLEHIRLG
jgi:molybdenum cofactor cytidylyltransferase